MANHKLILDISLTLSLPLLVHSESVAEHVDRTLSLVYHIVSTFMDIIRSFMLLDVQIPSPQSYAQINNIFCGDIDRSVVYSIRKSSAEKKTFHELVTDDVCVAEMERNRNVGMPFLAFFCSIYRVLAAIRVPTELRNVRHNFSFIQKYANMRFTFTHRKYTCI